MARKVLPAVRNFVAIPVEGELGELLIEKVAEWRRIQPDLKWEKRGNFHITLKFIGDSTERELVKIEEIISEVFSDIHRFSVPVGSVGAFPDFKRARVVWVGALFPDSFVERVEKFDRLLYEYLGIPREKKEFTPHITIARVKRSSIKRELLDGFREFNEFVNGKELSVDKVVHFKSELKPSGAVHTPLFTLDLR